MFRATFSFLANKNTTNSSNKWKTGYFFTNQPKNDNEQTKYCLDYIQLHNRLKLLHNVQKQNYCQNKQEDTFFFIISSDKKLEAKDEKKTIVAHG